AGAEVLRADGDDSRSVTRDGHVDFALVVSAAAPDTDAAAHAALQWTRIAAGDRIASRPANLSCATVQLPVIHLVAQVLLAKLDGVHFDLVREFVHQRL